MRHKYNSIETKYISKTIGQIFRTEYTLTRDISRNINSGCISWSQTKVQHLMMSVSNVLVVDIPTRKVSIKQTAINEVQKKKKSLNSLFENKKNPKADIQVPVPLQSVKSHSQKPMESL